MITEFRFCGGGAPGIEVADGQWIHAPPARFEVRFSHVERPAVPDGGDIERFILPIFSRRVTDRPKQYFLERLARHGDEIVPVGEVDDAAFAFVAGIAERLRGAIPPAAKKGLKFSEWFKHVQFVADVKTRHAMDDRMIGVGNGNFVVQHRAMPDEATAEEAGVGVIGFVGRGSGMDAEQSASAANVS